MAIKSDPSGPPCEGGICKWPTEYKWCGWTAATEGDEHCRAMYQFIYGATVEDENDWSAIVKRHEEAIRRRLVEIEEYSPGSDPLRPNATRLHEDQRHIHCDIFTGV